MRCLHPADAPSVETCDRGDLSSLETLPCERYDWTFVVSTASDVLIDL